MLHSLDLHRSSSLVLESSQNFFCAETDKKVYILHQKVSFQSINHFSPPFIFLRILHKISHFFSSQIWIQSFRINLFFEGVPFLHVGLALVAFHEIHFVVPLVVPRRGFCSRTHSASDQEKDFSDFFLHDQTQFLLKFISALMNAKTTE